MMQFQKQAKKQVKLGGQCTQWKRRQEKERKTVKSWACDGNEKGKKRKSFSNTLTMVGGDDALGQQQQEKEGKKLW